MIRRDGFASRISKNTRPHDPGGGGGNRAPNRQNCVKTQIKKPPMDVVKNPKLNLPRVSFKAAEEASSDGATKKQCLNDDQNYMKTTITKLPTDFVDTPKSTLSRMCIKVAEEASTDGDMNVQCLSDDQNYNKTTNKKMPMDYLEIPEPSFTRGFLELAELARNVCVENEQCLYIDEVLPQVAGMTKLVVVTIAEYSHPSLNDGATIAPRISTEKLKPVVSAGRCSPVDQMGRVMRPISRFCPDRGQNIMEPIPLARWARTSRLTKFSQWLMAGGPVYHT